MSLHPVNYLPSPEVLPPGFLDFLKPLHRRYTPWQLQLAQTRRQKLLAAHAGDLPAYYRSGLHPAPGLDPEWRCTLPGWIVDQRNQMTGRADDAELCVKMLNSGAPGVMLDLEDSMANYAENLLRGHANAVKALHSELTYEKNGAAVGIRPSSSVTFVRVRGLHLNQWGVFAEGSVSTSLFDTALLVFSIDPAKLKHPLCIYIPKSESAAEALWWSALFKELAIARGLPKDWIKCMALVEAHPFAFELDEFIFALRDHVIGLNLGRWDYMASLIHYMLPDPAWVLPDRNTIPHDVPFFQHLREWLPEVCHRRGIFAIGGMTALYPSRTDAALNARALKMLEADKKNEAHAGMDGAWTGHPDQNAIAVAQFPVPNQLDLRRPGMRLPDLRPAPRDIGRLTSEGTRAAVRTIIRYRHGVLNGKGASLIDGYMEDLATDRIYRLMIAQRLAHNVCTPGEINRLFDAEARALSAEAAQGSDEQGHTNYAPAAQTGLRMILLGQHDPS